MRSVNQWIVLGGFVAASFAAAALGGVTTASSVRDWYPTLVKPAWNPPAWIFGPVWTVLYLAMAVAAWLVWCRVGWGGALVWFVVQLALNATWSPVFFGMHRIGLALVNIVLLWAAIAGTMVAFWKVAPVAGWLFVPYLAWVSFATVLNYTLWRLNGPG
ncbi:MAG: TspO/MBR family protein [Verrucomicrobiota bacterium]